MELCCLVYNKKCNASLELNRRRELEVLLVGRVAGKWCRLQRLLTSFYMKFFPFGNTGQAQLAPCASAQRKEGGGEIIPQKKKFTAFFRHVKEKKPSSLSILLAYFFAKARRESAYCPLPPGSQYHFGLQQQPHLRFLPPLFSLCFNPSPLLLLLIFWLG